MLDRFSVKNFKAFQEAEIKIAPITIIVGPNNAGKSSLIQAIILLQQTLLHNPNNYTFYEGASNSLGEQTIDIGNFTEIINHLAFDNKIGFKLGFSENSVEFNYRISEEKDVYVSDFLCDLGDFQYSLRNLSIEDYSKKDFNINNIHKFSIELDKYFWNCDIAKVEINPKVYREGFFFHIASFTPAEDSLMSYYKKRIIEQTGESLSNSEVKDEYIVNKILTDVLKSIEHYNKITRSSYSAFQRIKKDFSNIKYIGPIRKTAERSYIIENFKGLSFNGEHTTQILATDHELRNRVEHYLKKMGIAENIQIYLRSPIQRSFEFKLKTKGAERGVNFKDVGCGICQILPVIVQSLMTKDESLVILEQPEVHLHPKTQADLADFFVEVASKNNRFLIETHSDFLIERLRYRVATEDLRFEDLAVYYIDHDNTTNSAKVTKIIINKQGQYQNIPPGYLTNFRMIETSNMTRKLLENLSRDKK